MGMAYFSEMSVNVWLPGIKTHMTVTLSILKLQMEESDVKFIVSLTFWSYIDTAADEQRWLLLKQKSHDTLFAYR
jgi:hypothetical protein